MHEKIVAFKKFRCNRNNSFIKRQLNILQDQLVTSIEASKQKYYCKMATKLIDTKKKFKSSLVIAERFLNNKGIPLISPLFYEQTLKKSRNFLTPSLLSHVP